MSYDFGRFVWFELITSEIDKAKTFYPEVFGWKVETMEMSGGVKYPLVKLGDQPIAGFAPPPKPGLPPHWVSYVSVPDVDASAKKVLANGGKSLMDAFDIPGVGRMQPVTDPEGSVFFLFHGAQADAPALEGPGSFAWNELLAVNAKSVAGFYEKTLGYKAEEMVMPNGTYYVLKEGDKSRAGIMDRPSKDIPAHWAQYVTVDDCTAAIGRAKRLGGKALGELIEVPDIGQFGFISDNVGAVIGILKPAARKS